MPPEFSTRVGSLLLGEPTGPVPHLECSSPQTGARLATIVPRCKAGGRAEWILSFGGFPSAQFRVLHGGEPVRTLNARRGKYRLVLWCMTWRSKGAVPCLR